MCNSYLPTKQKTIDVKIEHSLRKICAISVSMCKIAHHPALTLSLNKEAHKFDIR